MDWEFIVGIASLVVGFASLHVSLKTLKTSKKIKEEVERRITRGDFHAEIDTHLNRLGAFHDKLYDSTAPLERADYYNIKEELSLLLTSYENCLSDDTINKIKEERDSIGIDAEKTILLDDSEPWHNKIHYRNKHAEQLTIIIQLLKSEQKK